MCNACKCHTECRRICHLYFALACIMRMWRHIACQNTRLGGFGPCPHNKHSLGVRCAAALTEGRCWHPHKQIFAIMAHLLQRCVAWTTMESIQYNELRRNAYQSLGTQSCHPAADLIHLRGRAVIAQTVHMIHHVFDDFAEMCESIHRRNRCYHVFGHGLARLNPMCNLVA